LRKGGVRGRMEAVMAAFISSENQLIDKDLWAEDQIHPLGTPF